MEVKIIHLLQVAAAMLHVSAKISCIGFDGGGTSSESVDGLKNGPS